MKYRLLLFVLLLVPLVVSLSSDDVKHEIGRGYITIKVESKEQYSSVIEFDVDGEIKRADFTGCEEGICKDTKAVKVLFSDSRLDIYKPGNYSYSITSWPDTENRIVRNFILELTDLWSCEYNGEYVKDNQCYFDVTGGLEDKPKKCKRGKLIYECGGVFACGCPSDEYLCCVNERIEECEGNLGGCVLPSESRILEKEIKEEEKVIGRETVGGCSVQGYDVPHGVCLNNILSLDLNSNDDMFAQQCYCSEISSDLDGDGFDSVEFKLGRDCDDGNPSINPIAIESCSPDVNNNNGIDENCDGNDLDCSWSCDRDNDEHWDNNRWYCRILPGGKDCDDGNANRYFGHEEICEDQVDNGCDGIVDNPNICICVIGEERAIGKVRRDGLERCIDGKRWEIIKEPNENPLIYVKTSSGRYENEGLVDVNVDEEFEVEVKFLCAGDDCDVEI